MGCAFGSWFPHMNKPRVNKRSSDEAVKAKTGKIWADWFRVLDKDGAKKLEHQEIVKLLQQKHKVGSWWCQMVAVEYEHERGIRGKHQKCDGEFAASGSRTMAVPVAKAYSAWVDDKVRKTWLGAAKMEISTKTENKSLQAAWDGNKSRLSVMFYAKGPDKTRVVIDHMKLADSDQSLAMKSYWFAALDRLQKALGA
jgi:hypothetical protein